jgi:hypothetical protein
VVAEGGLAERLALLLRHLGGVAEEVDRIRCVTLQLQFWDRLKLLLSEAGGLVELP